ncbi:hypothetical protein [Streptosporangium sp. NPDC051022]|uniref:hypothetical protein n=1 Tax=Streptosporangium sp. NPDC051022 TaxID=3155752 RepID=UPI003432DB8B
MTPPILGQRSRGELITELYDHHAAGLFGYCHDQLGDPAAAAATLTAVFTDVPAAEPPRAALYALARREIQQRDVVYAPPAPGSDPVSVFVERVLRDLRPHQREVLYLSGVCEMDSAELSWVLDVATDTADELTVSACRRFAQSLELALASARIPGHLADTFGSLGIAPIRDVLVRAPWAVPPAALRATVLGTVRDTAPRPSAAPGSAVPPLPTRSPSAKTASARAASPGAQGTPGAQAASPSPAPLKPLWPTPPSWPLPLTETDALTNTSVFSPPDLPPPLSPASFFPVSAPPDRFPDPLSPPDPDVVSAHEATTEPMPKLKDSVLSALDELVPRSPRRKLQRPKPRRAASLPAPIPGDVLDDVPAAPAAQPGATPANDLFQPFSPESRATRTPIDKLVASAPRESSPGESAPEGEAPAGEAPGEEAPAPEASLPDWPLSADELDAAASVDQEPRAVPPAPPEWPLQADELSAPAPGDRARHAKRSRTGRSARAKAAGDGRAPRAERTGLHRAPQTVARPGKAGPRAAEPETEAFGSTEPGGGQAGGAEPREAEQTGPRAAAFEPAVFRTTGSPSAGSLPETDPHTGPVPGEPETAWLAKPPAADAAQAAGAAQPAGTNRAAKAIRAATTDSARAARAGRRPRRVRGDKHHDWAWELFGFIICVICVAIAMLVFFAVPTIVTP